MISGNEKRRGCFVRRAVLLAGLIVVTALGWHFFHEEGVEPYGTGYSEEQRKNFNFLINHFRENEHPGSSLPLVLEGDALERLKFMNRLAEGEDAPLFDTGTPVVRNLSRLQLGAWGEIDLLHEAESGHSDACMELAIRFLKSTDISKRIRARYWLKRAEELKRPGVGQVIDLLDYWLSLEKNKRPRLYDYWFGIPVSNRIQLPWTFTGYDEFAGAVSSGDAALFIAATQINPELYYHPLKDKLFALLQESPKAAIRARLVQLRFFWFFYSDNPNYYFHSYHLESLKQKGTPRFSTKSWTWLPDFMKLDFLTDRPMRRQFDEALQACELRPGVWDRESMYTWLILKMNEFKPLTRSEWEQVDKYLKILYNDGDARIVTLLYGHLGRTYTTVTHENKLSDFIRTFYRKSSLPDWKNNPSGYMTAMYRIRHTSYGLSEVADILSHLPSWSTEQEDVAISCLEQIRALDLSLVPGTYSTIKLMKNAPKRVGNAYMSALVAGWEQGIPSALYLLGWCQILKGDNAGAVKTLNEVLNLPVDDTVRFIQDDEWDTGFCDTVSGSLSLLINLYHAGKTRNLDWLDFYQSSQEITRPYHLPTAGALCNLGMIYEQGMGIPVNIDKAVKCYRQARDKSARANLHLGIIYEQGRPGFPADPAAAYEYYSTGLKLIPKKWIPISERSCKEELQAGLERTETARKDASP